MKSILRITMLLLLSAVCLFHAHLRAGDKKPEPAKEIVVNGELMNSDLKDKVRQNMFCKTYTYKMIAGRDYQLDMKAVNKGNNFDPYLRLENFDGVQVAF